MALTEQEVRSRYITPAIREAGWPPKRIREEYAFTDGRVIARGGMHMRGKRKQIDYLLEYRTNLPLAIVEAKRHDKSLGSGMQQGLDYAEALAHAHALDVPFVYSSNGDGFVEHDRTVTDGPRERVLAMDAFPSPDELWRRYRAWKGLSPDEEEVVLQEYHTEIDGKTPRYYQRVAINRAVEAYVKGQRRMLLVMATGTGKTYTAFQIIWRLWKARRARRILFLADLNVLADQAKTNDFRPFGEKMTKITDHEATKSHEIYLALYQALTGSGTTDDIYTDYSADFFDLIVIDECHRGSARENSEWRKILDHFSDAAHLGLTATPKETTDVSNQHYFGEPIYTYSLKQGINDGFLAPYRVVRVSLDKDVQGYRPEQGKRDRFGREIEDREYTSRDFDRHLVISPRTETVAAKVSQYLRETDPFAKTIVFCEDVEHAERMRRALVNQNPARVAEDGRYVMRITGDSKEGRRELDNFRDPESRYPVVATTSRMLTTGVDVQTCKLIVLDANIRSMTDFKQIIGRGTRIKEAYGKRSFTIMDFRGVTRIFADPDFDGEPEVVYEPDADASPVPPDETPDDADDGLDPGDGPVAGGPSSRYGPDDEGGEAHGPGNPRKYYVDDVPVTVVHEQVRYYSEDGGLVTESLRAFTRARIRDAYASLDAFLTRWTEAERKAAVIEELRERGVFFEELQSEVGRAFDPFDLVCHVAFDKEPLTRRERARALRQNTYFDRFGAEAREVLDALLDKYADGDIDDVEGGDVLTLDPLTSFGAPLEIAQRFDGPANYKAAVREMSRRLYKVA
jgi:type I restriction enzyme R subunit